MAKKKEITPREMRKAKYEEMQKSQSFPKESDVRQDFKKYFVKLKRKLNLSDGLEEIIWLHFKSAGFNSQEKFDEGIRHFGYKI